MRHGLAHIVNRERTDAGCCQRFHFDTGFSFGGNKAVDADVRVARHINLDAARFNGQRVAKWNEIRRSFDCHRACNYRRIKDRPFFAVVAV